MHEALQVKVMEAQTSLLTGASPKFDFDQDEKCHGDLALFFLATEEVTRIAVASKSLVIFDFLTISN